MRANNNPDASSLADASQPKILRNCPLAATRKTPLQLLCASAPDRPPWKHLMGTASVITGPRIGYRLTDVGGNISWERRS